MRAEEVREGMIITSWRESGWFQVVGFHSCIDEGSADRIVEVKKVVGRNHKLIKNGYRRLFYCTTFRESSVAAIRDSIERSIKHEVSCLEALNNKFLGQ